MKTSARAIAEAARVRVEQYTFAKLWEKNLELIEAEWPALQERVEGRFTPTDSESLRTRTWQLLGSSLGDDPALGHDLRLAVEREPHAALHNALGLLAGLGLDTGEQSAANATAAALRHFRAALAIDPADALAGLNAAEALASLGQSEEAVVQARQHAGDAGAVRQTHASEPRRRPFPARVRPVPGGVGAGRLDECRPAGRGGRGQARSASLAAARHPGRLHRRAGALLPGAASAAGPVDRPGGLGLRSGRAGQPAEAVEHLRAAVAANPFDTAAARALFQALIETGDHAAQARAGHRAPALAEAAKFLDPEPWFDAGPAVPDAASDGRRFRLASDSHTGGSSSAGSARWTPPRLVRLHQSPGYPRHPDAAGPRPAAPHPGDRHGLGAHDRQLHPLERRRRRHLHPGHHRRLACRHGGAAALRDAGPAGLRLHEPTPSARRPRSSSSRPTPSPTTSTGWSSSISPSSTAPTTWQHVLSDTVKVYEVLRPGGYLVWHDFTSPVDWVEVRQALDRLRFREPVVDVAGTSVAFLRKAAVPAKPPPCRVPSSSPRPPPRSPQATRSAENGPSLCVVWEGGAAGRPFLRPGQPSDVYAPAGARPRGLRPGFRPSGAGRAGAQRGCLPLPGYRMLEGDAVPLAPCARRQLLSPAAAARGGPRPAPVAAAVHAAAERALGLHAAVGIRQHPHGLGRAPDRSKWMRSGPTRSPCATATSAAGVPADRVHVVPLRRGLRTFTPRRAPLPLPTRQALQVPVRRRHDPPQGHRPAAGGVCPDVHERRRRVPGHQGHGRRLLLPGPDGRAADCPVPGNEPAPRRSTTSTRQLSEAELAGLYTACDCLVHPYRGEGFGLPIAEAMACGLPVIVTGLRRRPGLLRRGQRLPDPGTTGVLRRKARRANWRRWIIPGWPSRTPGCLAQHPAPRRSSTRRRREARGRRGRERIRGQLTWDHAAQAAERRMQRCCGIRPVRRHPVEHGRTPLVLRASRSSGVAVHDRQERGSEPARLPGVGRRPGGRDHRGGHRLDRPHQGNRRPLRRPGLRLRLGGQLRRRPQREPAATPPATGSSGWTPTTASTRRTASALRRCSPVCRTRTSPS